MVTVNLEHRARELLAAEYERDGRPSDADFTSGGLPVCDADIRALRAIEAALAQQPAAAAAADETVVPVAQVLRGGHGVAHDTLYVGLIPRGPATPEVKEGDLLYLAQQPAAVVDDARMAHALEWARQAAIGVQRETAEFLPAIEEAIAAYDPSCGARTVRAAEAWQEGYRQGVLDERTSEANIGIAGFNAKVEPARNNPYLAQQPAAVVDEAAH